MEEQQKHIDDGLEFLQGDKGQKLTNELVGHMEELRKQMQPSMDPVSFYKMMGQLISNSTFNVETGSELNEAQLDAVAGGTSSFGYTGYASPVGVGGFSRLGQGSLGLNFRLSAVNT